MITYVDNSNAQQYRVLYEKATRDLMAHNSSNELVAPDQITELNEPLITPRVKDFTENPAEFVSGMFYKWDTNTQSYKLAMETKPDAGAQYYEADDITSLNQYFSYIKNLAAIDPVYTRLPLDEDNFEINLNTRKIDVPAHFLQNGISVQGDEIAEVVYFKVNRFFDMEDLARDDIKIYIQWRSAESGPDGKLKEGVSVPWAVDYKTEPNYIIFGWPVSSEITGKAGEISFAVRFFKFDSAQQRIVYSLSTLTQTIAVKPSLDFDISEKIIDIEEGSANSDLILDDNTAMIQGRLENSQVSSEGVQAEVPFFFMVSNQGPDGPLTTKIDSTVGNGTGIIGGIQTSEGLVEEFWLGENPSVPGLYDQVIEFKTQASSSDAGQISYDWQKLGEDHRVVNDLVFGNKYRQTEDTSAQPGKIYYERIVRNAQEAYEKVETPDFTLEPEDEGYKVLYERFSVANINSVGYYTVTATNRVHNARSQKQSIRMHVKPPTEAELIEPFLPSRGILYAEDEYGLNLTVNAVADPHVHLAYQWYYNPTGQGGFEGATPIEGADEATYIITGTNEALENVGRVGDGFYYVKVYSEMNGINKNSPEAIAVVVDGNETGVRVTHQASVPQVSISGRESYNLAEVQAIGGIEPSVEIDPVESAYRRFDMGDTYRYQWFRYHAGDGTTTDADYIAAKQHTYVPNNDDELEGATDKKYTPTEGGFYYYCRVTNIYNGDEAVAYSPFFFITND